MPQKCRLACFILKEHFGSVVEQIAKVLLSRGRKSIRELIQETKLPRSQIQNALFVLLQHNLVVYQEDAKKDITYYQILQDAIFLRTQFPNFLKAISDHLGPDAAQIFQFILTQGRVSFSHIVAHVSVTAPQEAFAALLKHKYIHRLRACHTFCVVEGTISEDSGCDLRPAKKSAKKDIFAVPNFVSNFVPLQSASHKRKAAEISSPAAKNTDDFLPPLKRFSRLSSQTNPSALLNGSNLEPINFEHSPPKKASSSSIPHSQTKAVNEQVEEEEEEEESCTLWRIHAGRCLVELRNRKILEFVSNRIDSTAAKVFESIFSGMILSYHFWEEASYMHSKWTEFDNFFTSAEIKKFIPFHASISHQTIDLYLELLCSDQTCLLQRDEAGAGKRFGVDVFKIVGGLQKMSVESIVEHKFGVLSARIFRLLLDKKMLEQKQIGEMAMIPFKDAKEKLYEMLAQNIVHLQEVSRTPEHVPSRTIYLFTVRMGKLVEKFLQDLWKSLTNLKSRRISELQNRAVLLEKFHCTDVSTFRPEILLEVDSSSLLKGKNLSESERNQLNSLVTLLKQLHHAELLLYENLLVFNNFFLR